MNIHFACASCQTAHQAEARLAGRTLKCFQCGNLFVVPGAAPPVPAPPPPVARAGVPSAAPPAPLLPAPPRIAPPPPPPPAALPEEEPPFNDDLFGQARESAPPPLAFPLDEGAHSASPALAPTPAHLELADDPSNQATLALSDEQPPFGTVGESAPLAFPLDDGAFDVTEILDEGAAAYDFAEPVGDVHPLAELEELEELDILEAEPLEEPESPKPKQARPW